MYVVRFHVCRALQRVYTQASSCGAAAPASTQEACDAACLTQVLCEDVARPDSDLQGADRDFCIYNLNAHRIQCSRGTPKEKGDLTASTRSRLEQPPPKETSAHRPKTTMTRF